MNKILFGEEKKAGCCREGSIRQLPGFSPEADETSECKMRHLSPSLLVAIRLTLKWHQPCLFDHCQGGSDFDYEDTVITSKGTVRHGVQLSSLHSHLLATSALHINDTF